MSKKYGPIIEQLKERIEELEEIIKEKRTKDMLFVSRMLDVNKKLLVKIKVLDLTND